jgi:hypothetical protein
MTAGNLPEHSYLNIWMMFYAVASWDSETFYILVDDVVVYE